MERKFRTLNGKIATESELREYYGDEFDRRMNNGEFKQVADDEQLGTREEVGEDTELYITPNGMEVEGQELKDFYGLDDFNKRVNEGQIKKKNNGDTSGGNSVSSTDGMSNTTLGLGLPKEEITEQDYFTGAFGDVLRGIDSVSPIGIGDFIDDMARAVAGGVNQGIAGENASDLLLRGSMATEEDIASYLEANKNAQKYGSSAEMQEYQKTYEENGSGFMGVVMGLSKSGLTILPELVLSSFASMASNTDSLAAAGAAIGTGATLGATTGMVGGPVGGGVGAVAGAAAAIPYAFAAAGSALEMGATFSELLQEEIEGEMTPEKIREVLNDPEKYTSIRNKAVARGIVIGAIDAYTGKLGGKIATKVLTKGGKQASNVATKGLKLKSIAAAGGVEAVGGSTGETAARLAIGQDLDISEIALEGLAEIPGGVKDIVSTRFSAAKYKVNGERVDAATIDNLIETMTLAELQSSEITIDNDYEGRAGKLQDRLIELKIKQDLNEANSNLSESQIEELTALQLELNKLEGNKTQVAKEKANDIKAKIKELTGAEVEADAEADVASSEVTDEEVIALYKVQKKTINQD